MSRGLLEFVRALLGMDVTAPGGIGGQCVDLANLWLHASGFPEVRANAADWALPGALPRWRYIANAAANYPPAGAVVVWRRNVPALGIGPYGHVAVAVTADAHVLLTCDQDWPPGAPVALVLHEYTGVAGWWVAPGVMVK